MSKSMVNVAKARNIINKYLMKCIICEQEIQCNKKSINSHNIQNAKVLRKLSINNHVIMVSAQPSNDEFIIELKSIGINKATIFHCLCGEHDKQLFAQIEDKKFIYNKEQCFLYAYKSLVFEYWKQEANKHVIYKLMRQDKPYGETIGSNSCANELSVFEVIRKSKAFDELESAIIDLSYEVHFAVSSTIILEKDFAGNTLVEDSCIIPYLHITIFPEEGKTYIIFSWLKKYNIFYDSFAKKLKKLDEKELIKCLNVFLAMYSENIVISPTLMDIWSDIQKREFIAIQKINILPDLMAVRFCIDNWKDQIKYNLFMT